MINLSKEWSFTFCQRRDSSWVNVSTRHWSTSVALQLSRSKGGFPALNNVLWALPLWKKEIRHMSFSTRASMGVYMSQKQLWTCWRSINRQVHPLNIVHLCTLQKKRHSGCSNNFHKWDFREHKDCPLHRTEQMKSQSCCWGDWEEQQWPDWCAVDQYPLFIIRIAVSFLFSSSVTPSI